MSSDIMMGPQSSNGPKKRRIVVVVVVIVLLLSFGTIYEVAINKKDTGGLPPEVIIALQDPDGDGHIDDAFPNDPMEWIDSDFDGHGDNSDMFPYDASEWSDSDMDGIGNNADFYDYGNGKIKFEITWFKEDGTADTLSAADPYFELYIGTDSDGSWDISDVSRVFQDCSSLVSPYSYIFDIPDDALIFRFSIIVYDSDIQGTS